MSVLKRLRAGTLALCFLGLALAAGTPAAAAEIRAWDHGEYGRLVFDWERPVSYQLDVFGSRIVISFDRPVDGSLAEVATRLAGYVTAVDVADDGAEVALTLHRPVTVDDFVLGDRIVFDLRPAPEPPADPQPLPVADLEPASAPAPEPAVPAVAVESGRRQGFSRIAFDWPVPVEYDFRRDGGRVEVAFDRPGEIRPPVLPPDGLPNIVGAEIAAEDGLPVVALEVAPGHRVRHYSDGRQVIVDVLDDDLAPPSTAADAAAPPTALEAVDPGLPVEPPTPVPAAGPPLPLLPPSDEPAATATAESQPAPAPPAGVIESADPAVAAADAESDAAEAAEPQAFFDLGFPIFAGVFERAGHLWLTFASANRMDPATLARQGAALGPVDIVEAEGGVALRLPMPANRDAIVKRHGPRWTVTLTADPPPLAEPLVVTPQPDFPLGSRLLVTAPGARGLMRVVDPEVGDVLIVAPLPDAGMGLPVERRFAEVVLLPSFQGLVAQPISQDITLRIDREGVEVTAKDGLLLSPPVDRRAASDLPLPDNGERYLKIAEWQGEPGGFALTRRALLHRIADAPETERPKARLDLARFYFAHGRGPEALGPIEVLVAGNPALAGRPDFALLRGAARVLAGHLEAARDDLSRQDLINSPEAALWRGALAARTGDWQEAAEEFGRAGPILERQQAPFLRYLSVPAALAAVEVGDMKTASRRLTAIAEATDGASDEWPSVAYITGRINQARDDREGAIAAYARAAGSDDRLYRTRAELALISLRLDEGEMAPEAAVARLEGLRFAWRGDALEHTILTRLADSYWRDGRYREALETWERAIEDYPDLPASAVVKRDRADRVAVLFSTDAIETLSPIEAASIYEDYKALMPDGAVGDRVMRNLAERLVEIDLLDRAGNLLQQLVASRLEGPEKAEVGARLAGIRLLDGKPDDALAALDGSEVQDDGVPEELRFERRLLRARSLSELGRADEALDLLAGDESRLADAARLDIAWRSQNWAEAAAALDRLAGPPPAPGEPIPEEQAQMVLNRGIALALADDRTGLDELAARFGPAMAASPHAHSFAVLTRPNAPLGPLADLASIRREVAEVDLFQDFLSSYRAARPEPALTN